MSLLCVNTCQPAIYLDLNALNASWLLWAKMRPDRSQQPETMLLDDSLHAPASFIHVPPLSEARAEAAADKFVSSHLLKNTHTLVCSSHACRDKRGEALPIHGRLPSHADHETMRPTPNPYLASCSEVVTS